MAETINVKLPATATRALAARGGAGDVYAAQGDLPANAETLSVNAGVAQISLEPGEVAVIFPADAVALVGAPIRVSGGKQHPATTPVLAGPGTMVWTPLTAAQAKKPFIGVLQIDGTYTPDPDPTGTIALAEIEARRASFS